MQECVDWIHVTQDVQKWLYLPETVKEVLIP